MNFYKSVFGGELEITPMSNVPGSSPEVDDKIMHSHLKGGIIDLMGSDGDATRKEAYPQGAVSISVTDSNEEELSEAFDKLSEGGKVEQEIIMMPWGDLFGGIVGKYGIDWIFTIDKHA
jgi:PhnB protein